MPTCQSVIVIIGMLPMAWQWVMSNTWSNTQGENEDFAIINIFLPQVHEHLIGLYELEHHMGSIHIKLGRSVARC